jgi:hypothetical protein
MKATLGRNFSIALAIITILIVVYNLMTFSIFDEDKPIETIQLITKRKEYKVGIYSVPANATRNDFIQVRKVFDNKTELIASYERYQVIVDHSQLKDYSLMLVLRDTASYNIRQDTFLLNIPNL